MLRAAQHYDADDNIVFVSHPTQVTLTTLGDIDAYFDDIAQFWRLRCRRPAYYVVDYDGLSVDADLVDPYATRVLQLMQECRTLALYRYGGGLAQRATGRIVSARMRQHPTHLCGTREEAVAAIRRERGSG